MTCNVLTKVVQLRLVIVCSMVGFSLNNLSIIKKLVANHVSMGFLNIRLVHNDKILLMAYGVIV